MKDQQLIFDIFSGELKTKEQADKEEKERKEALEKQEKELSNSRRCLIKKIATALRSFDNDEEDLEDE